MSHPSWLIPTGMWLQIVSLYTEMPTRICLKWEPSWLHQPSPKGSYLCKKSFNLQLMLYSTFSIWGCRERRLNLCISMQPGPTTPAQSFREKESCLFATESFLSPESWIQCPHQQEVKSTYLCILKHLVLLVCLHLHLWFLSDFLTRKLNKASDTARNVSSHIPFKTSMIKVIYYVSY